MAFKIPREYFADRQLNTIQQNFAGAVEPLFNSLSGQFVVSLTGCTTTPSGIVVWQRSTSNSPVTMQFPNLTGVSNTAPATLTGLPEALWPASTQIALFRIVDNGVGAAGLIAITSDGTMTLYKTPDGAFFTTSGSKGMALNLLTYMMGV